MKAPPPSRVDLEAERDFLLRSIADLDRERSAGDVDADDYVRLRTDYVARAAATLQELSQVTGRVDDTSEGGPGRRWGGLRVFLGRPRTRRALVVVGIVCVVAALGLTAAELAGARLPGESATGTVNLPRAERIHDDLAAAALFADSGQQAEAVGLYDAVLLLDPRQPVALADRGWLERLAGLKANSKKTVAIGDASIARAVAVDPGYADAHAYDAVALADDEHQLGAAVRQIDLMERARPSNALLSEFGVDLAAIEFRAHVSPPRNIADFARR